MAAMLRSYKILRILPQITRINTRSGYQHLQSSGVKWRQSSNVVELARAFSSNPIGITDQTFPDQNPPPPRQQQHRRPLRGRLQTDVQTVLRGLDDQVQRTGRLTEAKFRNVFDKVCNAGSVTPNQALLLIRSCGSLLVELSFQKRNELVMQVWDKLAELGVRFDVTHYNALLWVYLENEFKFSPTEFLSQMENKGIEPNRVTYQRLISVYCREGDIKGATLILEVLKSKDLPVTEGVFSSLILGNARAGDMESARNMLNVMRDMGLDPTLDTYISLACAYAEKGDVENINRVMDEAVASGFTLTPSFYFKLVNSLTTHGHKDLINQFLDKVELGGAIPDAINLSLSLWTQGYFDESFAVLKTFTTVEAGHDNRCSFYISHIMQSTPKPSTDTLLSYLDQIKTLGLHGSPYVMALVNTLRQPEHANEMSIALMKRMKERGVPIRPHYFWPMMVRESQQNNSKGVLDLLQTMLDMDVRTDLATYIDYVLPVLKGDARSVLEQIEVAGVKAEPLLYVTLCIKSLISGRRNAPAEVLEICESHPEIASYLALRRGIGTYFVRSRRPNIPNLVKLLKLTTTHSAAEGQEQDEDQMEMSSGEGEDSSEEEQGFEPQDNGQRDPLGDLLYRMIVNIKEANADMMELHLEKLFNALSAEGMCVSLGRLRGIRNLLHNKLRIRSLRNLLMKLADKEEIMADPLLNADFLTDEQSNECVSLFESGLKDLEKEGADTKNVLSRLIVIFAAQNKSDKVNEMLQEYENKGYVKSATLYRDLILMHCRLGNLEEALKLKQEMLQQVGTLKDASVYKEFVMLLMKDNKTEEAFQMIQEMYNEIAASHSRLSYVMEDTIGRVLDNLSELGLERDTWELLERCVNQGLVKPSRRLVQPLIDVYLQKDDLAGAVKSLKEINSRYELYPSDQEVLVKLIDTGNKHLLQEAIRNLSELQGEVNMIFSLAFAFLENKKFEEAEKLMKAPGIDARMERMNWFANRCLENDLGDSLEKFVDITEHVYGCDRDTMYYHLMRLYGDKQNNPDKCLEVYHRMQEEDLIPSAHTLRFLAEILQAHDKPVPFDIPEEEPTSVFEQTRGRKQPTSRRESRFATATDRDYIPMDPDLSPLEQVNVLVNDYQGDPRRRKTLLMGRIRRCVDEDSFENFLAIKQACEQIPGFTASVGFRCQEIRAHVANNDLKGAYSIYADAFNNIRIPPGDIVRLLGHKYAEAGQAESLLEMKAHYESVAKRGTFPGNGFVLEAYATRNDISGAIKYIEDSLASKVPSGKLGLRLFFTKMMEKNLPIDSVMGLVDNCSQQGDFLPAKSLVYSYMANDKLDEAKELIQKHAEMKGCLLPYTIQLTLWNDVPVDRIHRVLELTDVEGTDRNIVYSYLLKGYAKNGDWEGALQAHSDMLAEGLKVNQADLKRLAILLKEHDQPVPFDEPHESFAYYIKQNEDSKAAQRKIVSEEEMELSQET